MKGTNIYFESKKVLSKWEMQNCHIIVMTDDSPWDSSTIKIAAVSPTGVKDQYIERERSTDNPALTGLSEVYDDSMLLQKMVSAVNISPKSLRSNVSYLGTKNRHSQVTAEEVAWKFRCGIETAKQTLKSTTQHGV
jgi:hypothetical protein